MFNDLQGKTISEAAVIASHKNMAKLSLFAKSYSPANGTAYGSVVVPVYNLSASGDFVAGTNDYGSGENEIDGKTITLNKHIVKSVAITDVQLAETGIAWAKDTATALADSVTRKFNEYVFGQLSSTTLSATLINTKDGLADLYGVAENNDIPVDRCVVVLTPTEFSKALGVLDSDIYGGSEAIRLGKIEGLFGYKGVICSSNLPNGWKGAIIMDEAIGLANRYLEPGIQGAYPEVYQATDEDGLTLGFRKFMNLNTGYNMFACDFLGGMSIIQPNKIVKLM